MQQVALEQAKGNNWYSYLCPLLFSFLLSFPSVSFLVACLSFCLLVRVLSFAPLLLCFSLYLFIFNCFCSLLLLEPRSHYKQRLSEHFFRVTPTSFEPARVLKYGVGVHEVALLNNAQNMDDDDNIIDENDDGDDMIIDDTEEDDSVEVDEARRQWNSLRFQTTWTARKAAVAAKQHPQKQKTRPRKNT